ncbi:hypothetical protein HYC85_028264 [Camellia sinensis]|uniref:Sulfite exporter TauE/SafE family protein n=1 Tax=Camellia sinensis TaxID=4442 RepID=A0A7J7FUN6_CAMSI|nr:hypothetical protein HYC85_028264 [Camellia sinensis]
MAGIGSKSTVVVLVLFVALVLASSVLVSAERSLKQVFSSDESGTIQEVDSNYFNKVLNFLRQKGQSQLGYHHAWPEMKFGWRIIVGTIIGFFGAAFGSVGGVGGGGIFVPMLTLIIGFDAKSSTAISKCKCCISLFSLGMRFRIYEEYFSSSFSVGCEKLEGMITGAAAATVYYNLKLRHPTLDLPIIDYDLALLFQPMLEVARLLASNGELACHLFNFRNSEGFLGSGNVEVEYKPLLGGPVNGTQMESKESQKSVVSIVENVRWKELGMLVAVWVIILALQIAKVSIGQSHDNLFCSILGGKSVAGVKRHSFLCHDVFCIHVCCRILPSEPFTSSLCSLLRCCGYHCCVGRATCGGVGISDMIKKIPEDYSGFENICAYEI